MRSGCSEWEKKSLPANRFNGLQSEALAKHFKESLPFVNSWLLASGAFNGCVSLELCVGGLCLLLHSLWWNVCHWLLPIISWGSAVVIIIICLLSDWKMKVNWRWSDSSIRMQIPVDYFLRPLICLMPPELRRHWLSKPRSISHRSTILWIVDVIVEEKSPWRSSRSLNGMNRSEINLSGGCSRE